jgi:hypothetical protein
MATAEAIPSVGLAILGTFKSSGRFASYPRALFELYQPANFREPMAEGVSLYLYSVTENASARSARDPRGGGVTLPPMLLHLHFLLTPWSPAAQDQQRLLGAALATLHESPLLVASILNSAISGGAPVFRPDESVPVLLEPLAVGDLLHLSSFEGVRLPTSLGLLARLAIDVPARSRVDT